MRNIYLLKDLASLSGYSTHTLKYYLRLGILKEIGRGPSTNFRYFDDSSVEDLRKIRILRKQGLTLENIFRQIHPDGNGEHSARVMTT